MFYNKSQLLRSAPPPEQNFQNFYLKVEWVYDSSNNGLQEITAPAAIQTLFKPFPCSKSVFEKSNVQTKRS